MQCASAVIVLLLIDSRFGDLRGHVGGCILLSSVHGNIYMQGWDSCTDVTARKITC